MNKDQLAAELRNFIFMRCNRYPEKWDENGECLAEIKSAIEKAWAEGYHAAFGGDPSELHKSRAAPASEEKGGDATWTEVSQSESDRTLSNAAPTFNPKGAAAHASEQGAELKILATRLDWVLQHATTFNDLQTRENLGAIRDELFAMSKTPAQIGNAANLGSASHASEHKCDLPDSIKEALNSGDGTYRP